MSILGSLIIFYIVYRAVIRQRSSNSGKNGAGGPPIVHTTSTRHREQKSGGPVNHQAPRPVNNRAKQAPSPQMAKMPAEAQETSTMAYLEEKARQDAEEHARDKWEETRRLNKNYGGLRVADRLFEGDTVPGGKKCVACGYCGADNLIPMLPRERYSCYFCREPL